VNIVDLFCGCGGFSLGAHAAGLSPVAAFDCDPILTSSFQYNFPNTKLVLADLSKLSGQEISRAVGGNVDGVFGGPPCQAFSEIGRRRARDPRRNLVGDFFRLVSELRPSFFLMENVRGLGYRHARTLLERNINLVADQYEIIGPVILDAADYGAATRRPRLFVLGYDPNRCDRISTSDLEVIKIAPTTVRAAIGDLLSAKMIADDRGFDVWQICARGRPSSYASRLRTVDRTFTGHRSTVHTREVVARFRSVSPGSVDLIGRHPKLAWDGQCPTLRAGTGNDKGSYQSVRPIHPDQPRVISVREAARIQGFPDRFRFHPTIWHSFRMIGNSVSPIVSEAVFQLLAKKVGTVPKFQDAAE
jgi:DNA (cytosine-5)-methyltransferase 1